MRQIYKLKTNSLSWWQGIRHTIVTNNRCTAFHKEDYHLCFNPAFPRNQNFQSFPFWIIPCLHEAGEWQCGGGFGRRCRKRSSYMLVSWSPQKNRGIHFCCEHSPIHITRTTHTMRLTDTSLEKISSVSATQIRWRSERNHNMSGIRAWRSGDNLNHSSQFMDEDGQNPAESTSMGRQSYTFGLPKIVKGIEMEIWNVRIILMIAEWPFQ